MIAIHKQQSHFSLNPLLAHRRHPSAPPAVFVQPTRTPGLLSLSKPQQSQQHHPRQSRSSRQKTAPSAQPAPTSDSPGKLSTTISATKEATATPSPEKNRGRQHAKLAKEKPTPTRSTSQSAIRVPHSNNSRARGHHHSRQASPPNAATLSTSPPSPSQAEVPRLPSSNQYDPFLASDSEDSGAENKPVAVTATKPQPTTSPNDMMSALVRPAPTLTRPSGKLAKRRQSQQQPGTPSPPSKPVPTPRSSADQGTTLTISRSVPTVSHMPSRPSTNKRTSTAAPWSFPICDDSDSVSTLNGLVAGTAKKSVIPAHGHGPKKSGAANWQQQALAYDDGPRTAPLSSTTRYSFDGHSSFPSPPSPSPLSRRRPRAHVRAPSDGVFNMSMDEDSSLSSSESTGSIGFGAKKMQAEEMKMLFGVVPKVNKQPPTTPGRPASVGSAAAVGVGSGAGLSTSAGRLYASSMFQNSPSPEELPPPDVMFQVW